MSEDDLRRVLLAPVPWRVHKNIVLSNCRLVLCIHTDDYACREAYAYALCPLRIIMAPNTRIHAFQPLASTVDFSTLDGQANKRDLAPGSFECTLCRQPAEVPAALRPGSVGCLFGALRLFGKEVLGAGHARV